METFVVRVFVPATDEQFELTGVVEHSTTGRSEHFRGADGLLAVVLHQLELGHGGPQAHDSPEGGAGEPIS